MNTNNIALRAAMIIALGTPAVASATVYSPGVPIYLASELVVTANDKINFGGTRGITIDMKEFINRTIGAAAPVEVRLSLTNGATFQGLSTLGANALTCAYKAGDKQAASMLNGTDGETVVTFKLADGAFTAAVAEAICVFTGGIALSSGSKNGLATYDMAVSAQLKPASPADEPIAKSIAGTIVGFQQAYSTTVALGQVTIDVADPSFSQKFAAVAGVTTDTDGKSAALGTITYKKLGSDVLRVKNAAGEIDVIDPAVNLLAGNTTVTLSGPPLQAGAGGTTVSVGRGPLAADACSLGAVGGNKTPSASGVVVFDNITETQFVAGTTFCYIVDGATRVDKGLVSFEIKTTEASPKMPNVAVAGEKVLTTFYKNGTSVKILTIPDPTDLNNELNIRIYNMSTSKVKAYGTLYKPDGTTLGTKNTLLGEIDGNAVKVLKTTNLATVFGVTTWGGGRAWMQIEGDSQQLRVQALAKTAGTMVNMSDRVIEDGGAFYRSDAPWKLKQ